MIASYSEYLKKKAMLAAGGDYSEEAVAKVQAALDKYEDDFLAKGAAADELPLKPDEGVRLINQAKGLPTQDEIAKQLMRRLDPSQPLAPQVLAIQPSTTHPKGDEHAKDEWLVGDLDNPAGKVVVYDAPVAIVRQKLLENPQLFKALGYDAPLAPDAVMGIKAGDSVVQAYNDHLWRETADGAAKAGKTAYRYSKAPWLGDGKGAGVLDSLSTKLGTSVQPGAEKVSAFVMGADRAANFGAGRAGAERNGLGWGGTLSPEQRAEMGLPPIDPADPRNKQTPLLATKDETVGGVPKDVSLRERNDIINEEHPYIQAGGMGVGMLAPWSLSNKLFGATLGATKAGATALGATGTLAGMGAEVAGSAAGAAAVTGAQNAVTAATDVAEHGETPITLRGAAGEMLDSAQTGGILGTAAAAAQGFGHVIRESPVYEALPGTVERLNAGKVQFGRGHVEPKAVTAAKAEARARSVPVKPVDVIAEKLDGPLTAAAKANTEGVNLKVKNKTAEVAATPEGRKPLPATRTAHEALRQYRQRTSSIGGAPPTAIGVPNAERGVKGIFNTNIEGVSVEPREGWIPVPVKEADALLNPGWQRRAVKAANSPAKQATHARSRADLARTAAPVERAYRPGVSTAGDTMDPEAAWRSTPGAQRQGGSGGALAKQERGLAQVPRYRGARRPELPPAGDIQRAAPDQVVQGSRAATEAERAGSRTARATQQATAREVPQGSRWQRRSQPEPPATPAGRKQAAKAPGSFTEEMRRRGVKTLYVAPRKYDLLQQESVINRLRTKGADSANDRDLKKIGQAALQDRDARTLNGEPGGWSRLQQQHEKEIRAAKDTQKRAAPKEGGAYQAVIRLSHHREGQSQDVRAMEDTAARAGGDALEQFHGARVMGPHAKLQAISGFGKAKTRMRFGPSAIADAVVLRGLYPVTRSLEHANLGRAAAVHTDSEHEKKRRRDRDEAHRAEYETKVGALPGASERKGKHRKPPRKIERKAKP